MVFRPHEGLEEAPRPPSGETEQPLMARRQRLVAGRSGRQADALGDERREYPEDDERRPRPLQGCERPGGEERQDGGGSRECSPEVVEHLPPAEERHACGAPPDDPREELPVTARPAMLAERGHLVVGRELLEEGDV